MKKAFSLLLALALLLGCVGASAAVWPDNTPVIYIGYGAGGGTDNAVRPIVAEMEKYLGETINCVNMAGANSSVACEFVLNNPHDGYSMFATGTGGFGSFAVNEYSKSTWADWYGFHAYSGPAAIVVQPDSDLQSIDDLLAYLGSGNVNFGIGSFGNGPHTQFEAILAAAGLGDPNFTTFGSCRDTGVAVIAGDAKVAIASMSAVLDFINAGQLRALCVTSAEDYTFATGDTAQSIAKLVPGTESVPMLNETWPILIPRDAPKEIVDKVTEAFLHAVSTDAIKEYAASMGYNIVGYTGEAADEFMAYSFSGYSWTIFNAGLATADPAQLGIPTLEAFDWDQVKLACPDYAA